LFIIGIFVRQINPYLLFVFGCQIQIYISTT
jgi:hypothetical protein